MSGKVWSCREKTLISWLFIVLSINALNYVVFNIMDIVLMLSKESVQTKQFFDTFIKPFAMFWFDTLNLTNGLCFLKLFEAMARRTL